MFSFPTAAGAASTAFTLPEVANRGIPLKKVFLKVLQNF